MTGAYLHATLYPTLIGLLRFKLCNLTCLKGSELETYGQEVRGYLNYSAGHNFSCLFKKQMQRTETTQNLKIGHTTILTKVVLFIYLFFYKGGFKTYFIWVYFVVFQSLLNGLMCSKPEDPVEYLESCLQKVKELGGCDKVKWDTFVSQEKKTLPPLNGGQSRRSFLRNGNVYVE